MSLYYAWRAVSLLLFSESGSSLLFLGYRQSLYRFPCPFSSCVLFLIYSRSFEMPFYLFSFLILQHVLQKSLHGLTIWDIILFSCALLLALSDHCSTDFDLGCGKSLKKGTENPYIRIYRISGILYAENQNFQFPA